MKDILNLDETEVRKYFLSSESYFTLDLPNYFSFDDVLLSAKSILGNTLLHDYIRSCGKNSKPACFEDVNYTLINNKKAKYKWRKFELMHPIIYVGIVNDITRKDNWELICNRFKEYRANKNIQCCSLPIICNHTKAIINNWWNSFEQKSISCSLDYRYMGTTDIENCYPSIYTHSIAWAIHTKPVAKAAQGKFSYLGNRIDEYLQAMHYGQTNGIPQGSTLSDFLAEIVLGYADELLGDSLSKIGIANYQILRYRDDYRIFAGEKATVEAIIKQLAEVLETLNFNLNAEKTHITDCIVLDGIKADKLYSYSHPFESNLNLQKQLVALCDFSRMFPNSGTLKKHLAATYKVFTALETRPNSYEQIISVVIEIMLRNPSVYPICVGILSEIFRFLKPEGVNRYVERIIKKFENEPFSDYLEIWLQRITIYSNRKYPYDCKLCQKLYSNVSIWNSDWVSSGLEEGSIIDEGIIQDITPNLFVDEADKFDSDYPDIDFSNNAIEER